MRYIIKIENQRVGLVGDLSSVGMVAKLIPTLEVVTIEYDGTISTKDKLSLSLEYLHDEELPEREKSLQVELEKTQKNNSNLYNEN